MEQDQRWALANHLLQTRGYLFSDEIPDDDAAEELCRMGWLRQEEDRYYPGELVEFHSHGHGRGEDVEPE